jgi:hypothetical protein
MVWITVEKVPFEGRVERYFLLCLSFHTTTIDKPRNRFQIFAEYSRSFLSSKMFPWCTYSSSGSGLKSFRLGNWFIHTVINCCPFKVVKLASKFVKLPTSDWINNPGESWLAVGKYPKTLVSGGEHRAVFPDFCIQNNFQVLNKLRSPWGGGDSMRNHDPRV